MLFQQQQYSHPGTMMSTASLNRIEHHIDDDDDDGRGTGKSYDQEDNHNSAHPRTFPPLFPVKLFKILEDDNVNNGIISWLPCGKRFTVYDKERFVTEVIHHLSDSTRYRTFQKNLNLYCFEAIKCSKKDGTVYTHKHFLRGRPDLLHKIERVVVKKSIAAAAAKNQRESNNNNTGVVAGIPRSHRAKSSTTSTDLDVPRSIPFAAVDPEPSYRFPPVPPPRDGAMVAATLHQEQEIGAQSPVTPIEAELRRAQAKTQGELLVDAILSASETSYTPNATYARAIAHSLLNPVDPVSSIGQQVQQQQQQQPRASRGLPPLLAGTPAVSTAVAPSPCKATQGLRELLSGGGGGGRGLASPLSNRQQNLFSPAPAEQSKQSSLQDLVLPIIGSNNNNQDAAHTLLVKLLRDILFDMKRTALRDDIQQQYQRLLEDLSLAAGRICRSDNSNRKNQTTAAQTMLPREVLSLVSLRDITNLMNNIEQQLGM